MCSGLDTADIVRILWYNIKKYTMKNFNWYRIGKIIGFIILFYFVSIWEDPNMNLDQFYNNILHILITMTIYNLWRDVRNLKNK
jgi:hypothetical protein